MVGVDDGFENETCVGLRLKDWDDPIKRSAIAIQLRSGLLTLVDLQDLLSFHAGSYRLQLDRHNCYHYQSLYLESAFTNSVVFQAETCTWELIGYAYFLLSWSNH